MTRRRFVSATLAAGGALFGVPALGGCGTRAGGEAKQTGTLPFLDEEDPAMDRPFGAELDGRLYTDLSTLSPGQSTIPTERFFLRTRASKLLDRRKPWSVRLDGQAGGKRLLAHDLQEQSQPQGVHLMECSGNAPSVHFGLLGAATWDGVPLAKVLEQLKIPAGQKTRVLVSGFDKYTAVPAHSTPGCAWIFTMEEIASTGAFLATAMNGKPLTPDHGGPVRLFVPGWYGCASVKWVDAIELVGDDSEATSQMQEYASRTGQQGIPRRARDYTPPATEPASMPVRIEQWRADGRTEYRVVGIAWGGPQPAAQWEIRFGNDAPYVPVETVEKGDGRTWSFWSHTWRPSGPGRYTIRLRLPSVPVPTRRLDTGFYARTVEVASV